MKRKIAEKLMKFYAAPVNLVLRSMNYQHQTCLITKLFKEINDANFYHMVSFLPRKIENPYGMSQCSDDFSNICILLQGPICKQDNFTLESVRMYNKFFNNAYIVVSTWEDTEHEVIVKLEEAGAKVVLSKYPNVNGIGNVNYQLQTSLAGLEAGKKNGCIYAWKTRTDQRYYNPFSIPMLVKYTEEKKLIFLGGISNSFIRRSFHLSDFMTFGYVDEVIKYYGCKYDEENTKKTLYTHKNQAYDKYEFNQYIKEVREAEQRLSYNLDMKYDEIPIKYMNPETMLAYNYFQKKIEECANASILTKPVAKQYLFMLKNYVEIIDADSLGFFWMKYDYMTRKDTYFDRMGKLDRARWISLFNEESD